VSQELLDIALTDLVSNINIASCEGWTVLHRAAAFGSGQDINTLLRLGADDGVKEKELQLTPIAIAVRFANVATFEQLLNHAGPAAVSRLDSRGWTMLHLAAEQGNREMVTCLVDSGADIHAITKRSSAPNPNDIHPQDLTPLDVARSLGLQKLQDYVYGLQDANIDIQLDVEEVFWLADE
jgi:ankyrin repeat protein